MLGELAPKRVALANPERIAARVAGPMRAMAAVARPLVRFLSASTNFVTRLMGVKAVDETAVTPEEIRILIAQGTETGVFHEAEQDMIESVLHLDERRVGSLMTPRTQIVWIDVQDTADVIRDKVTSSRHSRFPVCEDSLENVLGILRTKDLLAESLARQPLDLRSVLQTPLFVPETTSALRMLEMFKEQRRHIALVTDEFGSIQGVVTHNDILEAVVGVMPSVGEPAAARRRAPRGWLMAGGWSDES